LGFINKLAGGVFNALKFAFIISVIFMFISSSTSISGLLISKEKRASSKLYEPIASIAPILLPNLLAEVENYGIVDEILDVNNSEDEK
jgi:membrane protein required for colicin V production